MPQRCSAQCKSMCFCTGLHFPGLVLQSILLACLVPLENGRTWILAHLVPVGTPNGEATLSQDNTNVNSTHRTHAIVNITLFATQYGRQLCDSERITSIGVTILWILHALLQTPHLRCVKQANSSISMFIYLLLNLHETGYRLRNWPTQTSHQYSHTSVNLCLRWVLGMCAREGLLQCSQNIT